MDILLAYARLYRLGRLVFGYNISGIIFSLYAMHYKLGNFRKPYGALYHLN